MRNLTQCARHQPLHILNVVGSSSLTRRLREMGFHSGCEVRLIGQAPFNGPLIVQLHDSVMALRQAEAECLLIK